MLWFFPKNILMLNFQEKTIFTSKMHGKHILMQDCMNTNSNLTVATENTIVSIPRLKKYNSENE
jgi:hypothetical protein